MVSGALPERRLVNALSRITMTKPRKPPSVDTSPVAVAPERCRMELLIYIASSLAEDLKTAKNTADDLLAAFQARSRKEKGKKV